MSAVAKAPSVAARASTRIHQCRTPKQLQRHYAQVASTTPSSHTPQPGHSLHGFTFKQSKHVPELELTALHFQHDKTGAEYMHLAKEDKNNAFSIGFKTNPPDNTGVPHILEHCTLCGSDQYPVRDPFFKMMPRSLNNFMNAMTYPEHTIYPFATTNQQDFKNLMSVYLDATLHPLLRAHDFAQEGWRIGPEDPRLPVSEDNKIVFKGVVYNEMKGNMSNADYLFNTRWRDHIFPAIKDSGGDPVKMTDLTYPELKQFHAEHYNPSNARIFTYGDMPYEGHLKQLDEQLARFEKRSVDTKVLAPLSPRGNQNITVEGPTDPTFPADQQHKASVTWMMGDTSDVLQTFSLSIIASVIMDGFSSPIYQNTIGVGWGASYSANTGFDPSGPIGMFTIGLNGMKRHDVPRLLGGIENTLQSVKRRGLDMHKIEGRLHQIELGLKHKSASFGMSITTRLQDAWFNGIDPFQSVAPEEILSAFRAKTQDPDYLQGLFEEYFLSKDTFAFVMEPSSTFNTEAVQEEAKRLESKISDANQKHGSEAAARVALENQESELLAVQESPEGSDASCLPTVHVRDIPREAERKPLRHTSLGPVQLQFREAPTNGLTYFRAVQTFEDFPDELRLFLPLFSSAIQRLGTKSTSLETIEDQIRLRTGGISMSTHSSTSPLDPNIAEDGISLSGTAFDRNVSHMYDLLRLLIRETDFTKRDTEEKLMELIKSAASTAVNDISDAGHVYARRFAEAGVSPEARLVEEIDGLTQIKLMLDLASRPSSKGSLVDVIDRLRTIQSCILTNPSRLRVAITCGAEAASENEQQLSRFLDALSNPRGAVATPLQPAPEAESQVPYARNVKSFFPLPYQVYYTGLASAHGRPYTHPDTAPLSILAELLTHKRMHPEIREKGGAYGASAYSNALRGTFGFATYRDPNPLNSLKVMQGAATWAAQRQWTEREIEEAKLSVFQGLDAPRSVSEEGMSEFLVGLTYEQRQQRRERLLDVKADDVARVAQDVVAGCLAGENKNVAVLGEPKDGISGDGWTEMPMTNEEMGGPAGEDADGGYVVL